MPPAGRADPFKGFRFLVEIDGLPEAAFSEVSGLGGEAEVVEYREGGDVRSSSRKLPGRIKYGNVTLERGVTRGRELYDWWRTVVDGNLQRRNASIVLLDDDRQAVKRWNLFNTWPAKYTVSPLSATANEVVIETLELAVEGFELD